MKRERTRIASGSRQSRQSRAKDDGSVAEDGFAVIRGVLDIDGVAHLRNVIERLIAEAPADLGVETRAGTIWIARLLGVDPAVDALCSVPEIVAAVATLLGPQPRCAGIRMRAPVGTEAQQALHADASHPVTPGADTTAQVLVFLDDVDDANGPTRVVPASHRTYALPGRSYADPTRRHPDEIRVHASAGDALVFSSHIWHSGTANTSAAPRRAITLSFASTVR